MRTALVLIAIPLVMWAESSFAMNDVISSRLNIRDELCPSSPGTNVVWFGGDGGGHVVRNGVWNWETTTGEAPQYFPDGDPVGNQYRDGWTFQDRTARNGPSPTGAGHWSSSGIYDFNNDTGSFAHRATTHANNGSNDGPDPLQGGWSLWIGTNLYLNPEDCAWSRAAGYGDGWSQGFQKSFNVPAGSAGIQYDLRFYHRYACEVGFDTCRVEISTDGLSWLQVGDATAPNGIFNGGDRTHPQPSATGGLALVNLITWPSGQAGTLYVRLRLVADAFFSDSSEGGNFFWGWQIDDVELLRNGVLVGTRSTFETGMDGWQPQSFEGFDFAITASSRPAGRIERISNNQLALKTADSRIGSCSSPTETTATSVIPFRTPTRRRRHLPSPLQAVVADRSNSMSTWMVGPGSSKRVRRSVGATGRTMQVDAHSHQQQGIRGRVRPSTGPRRISRRPSSMIRAHQLVV